MATQRVSSHLAAALLLTSLLAPLAVAQPWPVCRKDAFYTTGSTYQLNLDRLSATLPTNASRSLFATAAVGAAPADTVYALALCRGDSNGSACESCVAAAFPEAQQLCGLDEDVAVFYDDCSLRYSGHDLLANDTSRVNLTMIINQANVSAPAVKEFDAAVSVLLNATSDYAAMNSSRRFATGEDAGSGGGGGTSSSYYPATIYGLAQCTPDMSPADCRSCLHDMIALTPQYLSGRQGGRIIGVRCNFRYELNKFFNGNPTLRLQTPFGRAPAPDNATPTTVTPGGRKRNRMKIVLAITLPLVALMLAVTIFCLCFWRGGPEREHAPPYSTKPEDIEGIGSLLLDLSTVRAATDNFADSNWIGEGGFGAVYKGVLPDGQQIAVKRFSCSSGQGIQELKNELVLVSKLQHKNLARLVGVCLQEHEKLLVYEYMPKRSIDTILFDPEKSKELDWGRRLKIIKGIARGLNYLHEDSQLKIIHRDLKASNILLDSDYTPKISDFGLARLFGGDQSQEATKSVVGTYGYMAPEYAMLGHYSIKSDVFSFGVLILEILTGRRSSGSYNLDESADLISLVWDHWTAGTIVEIMDSSLRGHAPGDQMVACESMLITDWNKVAKKLLMGNHVVILVESVVMNHEIF
ncbi:unnamed protein product [Miscanthus lutarioriparius]|uniref:Uncharacterized protein n=1 Tax=Miscanthus lutarioriparius TaxID=422564 RepID=A0A811ND12_9POAL|nr:unnamed protein product [Miscanthus lutarioriparius]